MLNDRSNSKTAVGAYRLADMRAVIGLAPDHYTIQRAPREGLEPLISTVVALYPSVSYLGHQACDLVYCAED